MSTITENIKNILIQLAVDDKLPLDMTMLNESIFEEVLTEQHLREGLQELGCNTELVINTAWVNDALKEYNDRYDLELELTHEEKLEYLGRVDLGSFDGSIKEMLVETIEEDYPWEE